MDWQNWIKGLVSAAIGAAANAVTVMVADPLEFNFGAGIYKLGTVCAVSALVAVALYLKQSPIPCTTTSSVRKTTVETSTEVTAKEH